MKVIFAKNIGFCPGVKRAVLIAENSLKKDPKPIQFLGPLIHNEKVIEKIKKEGGKIISNIQEIKSGTLIIRAHGEILNLEKIKNIVIRDATCPLVKRAQNLAKELFEKGYQVLIIGDKKHPEVKGIKKNVQNKAIVIENKLGARNLKISKKIVVLSQTTQNLEKVSQILKILKKKLKKLKWINTLCPEVLKRQKELIKIIKKVDKVLVIGSKNSANTKRLVEISKKFKKPTWWINSFEELKRKNFKNLASLGVVSGTSTPDWEIKKIKKYFRDYD